MAGDPTIRRQVMAAAREILARDPAAPVGAITHRARVSRATFYRHFGSRDALLDSIPHERRPAARARILAAAQDMLMRTSLAELSMDGLAHAADVSRGTLYRLFPGKAALLEGLIQACSPFEAVQAIIVEHSAEPPAELLPRIARAVAGVAGDRIGLLRAVFLEVTSGSDMAIAGMRRAFAATLGMLAAYMAEQMSAGRVRPMHPLLAVQAFVGPVFFHQAIDEIVAVAVRGLSEH